MSNVMTISKRTASGLEEVLRTLLLDSDNKVPADRLADYYEAKYSVLREYLSGLSDEQARITVRNDPFVRESLSDYFYYMLYDEFGR